MKTDPGNGITKKPSSWYLESLSDIQAKFETNLHSGVSEQEAKVRLEKHGPNEIPEGKRESLWKVFWDQFRSPLIYILLVSSVIVFGIGDTTDGLIILGIILFNAFIGTLQEGRAQQTLLSLKQFIETEATVIRDGMETSISDKLVVPGDIIVLREGDKVPADARLIEAKRLKTQEGALTGESGAVEKQAVVMTEKNLTPPDQKNMVFRGTNVVQGWAKAVVIGTGLETQIGSISKRLSEIDTEIPLKRDIKKLSKLIVFVIIALLIVLFAVGSLLGQPLEEMFVTIVSLAVSVVPEGLPAVLTIVLARGVWRMAKRNALVKKLQAIETLGQAKIIAVDKTGTLTKNEMVLKSVYTGGRTFEVSGVGYEPKGNVLLEDKVINPLHYNDLMFVAKIAAFGVDARTTYLEKKDEWRISGDPTEVAMLVFGKKLGFRRESLQTDFPMMGEIPFDHESKVHVFSHRVDGKEFVTVIGAPEAVLDRSESILWEGKEKKLGKAEKKDVSSAVSQMADEGRRVLIAAYREVPLKETKHSKGNILADISSKNLTVAAVFGIEDSLRPEVPEAVRSVQSAGIRVVMITGDHKKTAVSIAKGAGIFSEGDKVLTGSEIESMSKSELAKHLEKVSVFARVTPEHKLQIIEGYRARKDVVAMTGDGVNDAPSLLSADLGVAMGKIGTEVAKEASDIIFLDDDLGTMTAAVEEGRNIYNSIKRVILYLFSTNIGEMVLILGALLLGFPLPLLPAQILWLNLVTDGFLDIALAFEPKEKNILRESFKRSKYITDSMMATRIFFMALPMVIGTLLLFQIAYEFDLAKALTVSLTAMAAFQWLNAWNCRSEHRSIFSMNPFSNIPLVIATIGSILLQVAAVYFAPLQEVLHTVPLTLSEWGVIIGVAFSVIIVEEVRKLVWRQWGKIHPMLRLHLLGIKKS